MIGTQLTASSRHIQRLITTYEKVVGPFEYDRFQTLFGVSRDEIKDPCHRIAIDYIKEIFESAYRVTGRRTVGLEFALKWDYQSGEIFIRRLGMVEDLYTFFLTNMHISRLMSDAMTPTFHPYDDENLLLEFRRSDLSKVSSYHLEFICLLFVLGSKLLLGKYMPRDNSNFKLVQFPHEIENTSIHENCFQLPVYTEKDRSGVVIKKAWLMTKIYEKPDLVKKIFLDSDLQNEVFKIGEFPLQVKKLLTIIFSYKVPDVELCCSFLNVSKRTMQRRLKESGTSFRNILDEVRKSQATLYINLGLYSIEEIAFILGYSNTQALYTSFQRWHDMPPRQYIEQLAINNQINNLVT